MPRVREGSVEFRNGCWQAHVWLPGPKPRKRQWTRFIDPQPKDRAQAKAAARIAQEILDTCGYVTSQRKEPLQLRLPTPERQRYEIALPADAELIVTSTEGLEVCAGRIAKDKYRIWTRKLHQERLKQK